MCKLRVKHWDIRRMLNDSLNQWRYVLASLVGLTILTILTTTLMVGDLNKPLNQHSEWHGNSFLDSRVLVSKSEIHSKGIFIGPKSDLWYCLLFVILTFDPEVKSSLGASFWRQPLLGSLCGNPNPSAHNLLSAIGKTQYNKATIE